MTHSIETLSTQQSTLTVNRDRLSRSVVQLAKIGQLPNGGVSRVAFTDADLQARQQVQAWMQDAGMSVRIDAAGNIIGRYAGKSDLPALATGSHIDTVPVAGWYDGCLGVLAGIEIVRALNERSIRLNHPIEVIVFTDEERSVLGSKAIAGQVVEDASYYVRLDGTPIQPCLEKIGGDWSKVSTAKREGEMAAFVELHVEQGGVLEHYGKSIGVVTGVVGQFRFEVTIIGSPNHAGTTPMNMRRDALVAASQVVLAVNRIALESPGDQVATVGYLTVSPNATNTIPGMVNLRIDLRDLFEENLDHLYAQIKTEIAKIATSTGTEITIRETLHIRPTIAAPEIMDTIEAVSQNLGLSCMHLPSRAGHDAQEMGRIAPMGMVFVPSLAGISHSEKEYTSPEECAQGANVLLQTFLKLDEVY
jgi:N-carbamoyl-L-amino-acid hydrolase